MFFRYKNTEIFKYKCWEWRILEALRMDKISSVWPILLRESFLSILSLIHNLENLTA